ncbi:hypothetical protein ACET9K_12675 [Aeromonas enteropelogenes]|uniref:hypothetical protein n=1 Tax=Aeromonas TaxID=642 RepID=UPI0038CF7A23
MQLNGLNIGGRIIDKLRLSELLLSLSARRPDDFVGLGLIVYSAIENLPVVPLGARLDAGRDLPITGANNVISTLALLATRGSSMHDGFHLIDAKSGNLTHIAQFVSPPLDAALANPLAIWPQGARQMTALLISILPQVEVAAVISAAGDIHIYKNGVEGKVGVCQ